ncbi:MAG TPA: ribonuclease HII [Coleofasciculaceae cyanobacterium]|jgi:ribonuclease HII
MKQLDFLALSDVLSSEPSCTQGQDFGVAGIDEVGRGALFGPVVAAAVILPLAAYDHLTNAGIADSKSLSAARRQHLAQEIKTIAIACEIGLASVKEIDRFNILQATFLAMKRAIKRLYPQPEFCLVDGNQKIPGLLIPQKTIVKGDQKLVAIAAASIIAKVWRDELITRLAVRYPGYDLSANKGYGTAKHCAALQEIGISAQHRRSFSPCQLAAQLI